MNSLIQIYQKIIEFYNTEKPLVVQLGFNYYKI